MKIRRTKIKFRQQEFFFVRRDEQNADDNVPAICPLCNSPLAPATQTPSETNSTAAQPLTAIDAAVEPTAEKTGGKF